MKKRSQFIFLFLVLFLFSNTLFCQEKKNSISLGGTFNHTSGIDDPSTQKYEGYKRSSIMSGVEIDYWRRISPYIECGTGFNFKNSRISSFPEGSYPMYRFKISELSIPILSKWKISMKNQNYWFISTGVYFGLQFNIKAETPASGGWRKIDNLKWVDDYSHDFFFTDLYLDAGYAKSLKKIGTLSISPFLLIRANETWLSTYQNRIQYGIKMNYLLSF